mmetsp:Transcript_9564/g.28791  ORF Transcript_9564/g.28791 Transcript_9564/m.28791 type:complete len:279 (-) Transcript_9564:459-1295(-)
MARLGSGRPAGVQAGQVRLICRHVPVDEVSDLLFRHAPLALCQHPGFRLLPPCVHELGVGDLDDQPGVHEGVPLRHIPPQELIHCCQVGVHCRHLVVIVGGTEAQHPALEKYHVHYPSHYRPRVPWRPVAPPALLRLVIPWNGYLRGLGCRTRKLLECRVAQLNVVRARIAADLHEVVFRVGFCQSLLILESEVEVINADIHGSHPRVLQERHQLLHQRALARTLGGTDAKHQGARRQVLVLTPVFVLGQLLLHVEEHWQVVLIHALPVKLAERIPAI